METVERRSLLYRSGLGFYCINHVQGCSHGCRYPCYAWMMAHSHGRVKSYEEWCAPLLVSNAMQLLTRELDRIRNKPEYIHLCLTTDPFMYGYLEVRELSLSLIELINAHGIKCSVLTKGCLPQELADTIRFPQENILGISLVSLDENFRKEWEPGAAPYEERIGSLRQLHDYGCYTLVHIEPYPTPEIITQDLSKLLERVSFADEIYFGRWNYNKRISNYPDHQSFYRQQAEIVEQFRNMKS